MMFIRPHYIIQQKENGQISYSNTDLMDQLVKDTYVLYAEEYQREHGSSLTPFEIFFQRDTSLETQREQNSSDQETSEDTDSEEPSSEDGAAQSPDTEESSPEEDAAEATPEEDLYGVSDDFQTMYNNWNTKFSEIRSFIE